MFSGLTCQFSVIRLFTEQYVLPVCPSVFGALAYTSISWYVYGVYRLALFLVSVYIKVTCAAGVRGPVLFVVSLCWSV